MQHFERGAQSVDAVGKVPRNHTAGFAAQDWTQALAAGEDAMAHGLMDGNRMLIFGWNQALQRMIGRSAALFQGVLQQHGA